MTITWKTALTTTTAAAIGVGAGTLAWAVSELNRFELKEHTLPLLPKGTLGKKRSAHRKPEFRILHVSDLHMIPGQSTKIAWVRDLARLQPDLVVNTGDNLSDEHAANRRRHEFRVGNVRLAVAGVDDPHHDFDDYDEIAGAPNPDADLALALLHAPEPRVLQRFAADGYQLSLSGHTHGGQVCLPGSKALVTNCGIDRDRVQGLHDFDGMAMHVSNGLGTSKYAPVRLFCRPSATLLRITEKDA